jgi:hypothetical protein
MLEGQSDIAFDFGVGVDQAPVSGIAVATTTFASNLASWDTASWDDDFWADAVGAGITKRRKAVNRLGYSSALRIKVATDSQTVSFISAHYTFAPGAVSYTQQIGIMALKSLLASLIQSLMAWLLACLQQY